jgi:sulfite reductase (NADPH) hemoprotein beta-component
MYRYDAWDQKIVDERVAQFRDQVARRIAGTLSEERFRALRLQNGLYLQRHAYMLRVAIPYGLLSSDQLRALATVARRWDKGYGHVSTRQNMQFNWPLLGDVPDILEHLAGVQMHAIQTSGNCIRNISADALAGVARDEFADPRPVCEVLRQWSTFHPEFAYLPRKFKIAVSGARSDRAAVAYHDIGIRLLPNASGDIVARVLVGGGLGRTPVIAQTLHDALPQRELLAYCEAILRVYNQAGNRDNKYRARIKILVKDMGIEAFRDAVHTEWEAIRGTGIDLTDTELERVRGYFSPPDYDPSLANDALPDPKHTTRWEDAPTDDHAWTDPSFWRWLRYNTEPHRYDGYRIVMVSLKSANRAPGDITADEMDAVAAIADQHAFGQIRTTHTQNMVLADIPVRALPTVWRALATVDLATPNIGRLTDLICCPGLDFCSLANASSIDVAERIHERFDALDYLYDVGDLELKMSGCINACGHHHVGHIGILGIDRRGEEAYQVMLGGSATDDASLGKFIGPAFTKDEIAPALERIVARYLTERTDDSERFLDTFRRVGMTPFKEAAYDPA